MTQLRFNNLQRVLAACACYGALSGAYAASCESLTGLRIVPQAIGLPSSGAQVSSATLSAANDPNGSYCRVLGRVLPVDRNAPEIRFQVNLPVHWNGKAIHFGGGGFNGTLVDGLSATHAGDDRPVQAGFATFGSDGGHQAGGQPAAFALNDEALQNFAGAQLKKVRDVAVQLMQRHYGTTPRRTYFHGASQGGHEALTVAQRWPQDYDGIVAIHPAYNFTALQLSGLHLGQALYRTPATWLPPQKVALIGRTALATCDALDGLQDDVIANVTGCQRVFKPESLRCADGRDAGEQCLSDAQLATVRAFNEPIRYAFDLSGVRGFARWPLLDGAFVRPAMWQLGSKPTASVPPSQGDAFVFGMADQMIRFMVLRDPDYNTQQFRPQDHVARLQALSKQIDASDPNLDAFRNRGGKLLLMHGTIDMAIPPGNSVAYWHALTQRYGQEGLRKFARFYVAPGFGHGDGPFQVGWNAFTTLDAWADQQHAPADQIVVDRASATRGRTRPLCEYPQWPQYTAGDANVAASFRCVAP